VEDRVLEEDSLITAVLFPELVYVKENIEPYSVILGLDVNSIYKPFSLSFYDETSFKAFIKAAKTYTKTSIPIITKEDIEVVIYLSIEKREAFGQI